MKKVFALLLAVIMVVGLCACGGNKGPKELRFVTGGESGTYYAFGTVIAQHATNDAGVAVTALAGNGSQNNVMELQDGNAELALHIPDCKRRLPKPFPLRPCLRPGHQRG